MNKVLIYSDRTSNRLTYIMDFMLGTLLGLEHEITEDKEIFMLFDGPKFSYASSPIGDEIFYEADAFLFNKDIHPQPINFCEHGELNGFYPVSAYSRMPFDMFASAFFMISRYEEYLPGKKDKYDRYRGRESMNFKGGFLEKPMIDYYAIELRKTLKEKFPALGFKNRKFNYMPTFDIDMAYSYLHKDMRVNLGGFVRALLLSDFKEIRERFLVLMHRAKDPFDTYDYIFKVCSKYGFQTRFFFLLGDKSRFDKNISYQNDEFRELVKSIADKTEAGIHLSFKSHISNERMQLEITRMEAITESKVFSNRFHYLRFQIPHSYSRLTKIGLREDHSMGYAGRVGFRAGTCTPFPFFNLKHNMKTDLTIYPFAFMDTTFTHYLKQDAEAAQEKIMQLMKAVHTAEGTLTGLWHNSSFTEYKEWKGWRGVFETVAKEASLLM